MSQRISIFLLWASLLLVLLLLLGQVTTIYSIYARNSGSSCNCVIFRMDDVQDNFVDLAQVETMNLFINKNLSLSLALIVGDLGNDTKVIGKVGEGSQKGLFELALHGFQHVDYTTLSESQQKDTLRIANEKMQRLYGNKSDIFIPPYGTFDNGTIKAMRQLGIKILSSALFSENKFDRGRSVFNFSESEGKYAISTAKASPSTINIQKLPNTTEAMTIPTKPTIPGIKPMTRSNIVTNNTMMLSPIFHIPAMTFFKNNEQNKAPVKLPVEQIIKDVHQNMNKYGYSVIVFHPQDFVKTNSNGKIIDRTVDLKEIADLSKLIDELLLEKIRFTTFSNLAGIETRKYSYFR